MHQQIEQQSLALIVSQRRYRDLLEAIPQMVWTANLDGLLEYVNRHWSDYTGVDAEQAGRFDWDRLLYPEDREPTWTAWHEASASGAVLEIEHRLRRASDGTFRWHLVRAVPMRSGTGELTGWLGTSTEVEDPKRAGNAALEEQRFKGYGRLAGGVAHDFNNLLVCILGGASCAMQSIPASHPAQEMLRGVVHAGERLAELTRRMLAYAGKATFYVEPTDLGELIREACDSIRNFIPPAIQLAIPSGIDMPLVKTDAAQMRLAIVDMVMNAAEAIGENAPGRISIGMASREIDRDTIQKCSLAPSAAPGQHIILEIGDTGCGMDEETRKKIFDPFFSTKFVGRGLGLAAVHGFVRSIGGAVCVENQPGEGTAFQILLAGCHGNRVTVPSSLQLTVPACPPLPIRPG